MIDLCSLKMFLKFELFCVNTVAWFDMSAAKMQTEA